MFRAPAFRAFGLVVSRGVPQLTTPVITKWELYGVVVQQHSSSSSSTSFSSSSSSSSISSSSAVAEGEQHARAMCCERVPGCSDVCVKCVRASSQ